MILLVFLLMFICGIMSNTAYPTHFSTDKMSESVILDVVRNNFKDHLILGEEGGLIGDTASDYLWCIDPLGELLLEMFL